MEANDSAPRAADDDNNHIMSPLYFLLTCVAKQALFIAAIFTNALLLLALRRKASRRNQDVYLAAIALSFILRYLLLRPLAFFFANAIAWRGIPPAVAIAIIDIPLTISTAVCAYALALLAYDRFRALDSGSSEAIGKAILRCSVCVLAICAFVIGSSLLIYEHLVELSEAFRRVAVVLLLVVLEVVPALVFTAMNLVLAIRLRSVQQQSPPAAIAPWRPVIWANVAVVLLCLLPRALEFAAHHLVCVLLMEDARRCQGMLRHAALTTMLLFDASASAFPLIFLLSDDELRRQLAQLLGGGRRVRPIVRPDLNSGAAVTANTEAIEMLRVTDDIQQLEIEAAE